MKTRQPAQSGSLHSACSALIRVCDVCGKVNAIDLDAERDMQEIDHTVKLVTREEAMEAWKDAGRCDHKELIESLRAQLAQTKKPPAKDF